MRAFYPFLMEEFNDIILTTYSHYTYLLGYDDVNGDTTYSGVYDIVEQSLATDSSQYVVLRNNYAPDGVSIPQYMDSVAAKLNLRRR